MSFMTNEPSNSNPISGNTHADSIPPSEQQSHANAPLPRRILKLLRLTVHRQLLTAHYSAIVLGLILISAAGLKARQWATDPVGAITYLLAFGLPVSRWVMLTIVESELAIGLWLLSGLARVNARRAAMALFGLFALLSLYLAGSGAASCGCFGNLSISPWQAFGIDLTAILALWCWRPASGAERQVVTSAYGQRPRVPLCFASFAAIATLATALPTLRSDPATLSDVGTVLGDDRTVILQPENWRGKRCPILSFIDVAADLSRGTWVAFFYHPDCPKCVVQLDTLRETVEQHGVLLENVAVVSVTANKLAPQRTSFAQVTGTMGSSHL
jgi:hypothetical protein